MVYCLCVACNPESGEIGRNCTKNSTEGNVPTEKATSCKGAGLTDLHDMAFRLMNKVVYINATQKKRIDIYDKCMDTITKAYEAGRLES